MGSKSVGRSRTPKPTFRRRGDFSPFSTLAAGDFMSEMHEVTPVSQPFPHFERLVDSREAAALLQIHPKTLQRLARKGEIRAMRIGKLWRFRTSDLDAWGAFEGKVSQLSVPSLTTEDRDETDEISARQPSDREACPRPERMGVSVVRTPGRRLSQATLSDHWFGRTISERGVGAEGRSRTSGRHQR